MNQDARKRKKGHRITPTPQLLSGFIFSYVHCFFCSLHFHIHTISLNLKDLSLTAQVPNPIIHTIIQISPDCSVLRTPTNLICNFYSAFLIASISSSYVSYAGSSGLSFLICSVLLNKKPALLALIIPKSLWLSPDAIVS